MATVTQHAPGTFNWPELLAADAEAAKKFYSALFGWTITSQDMGEHGMYHIFQNAAATALPCSSFTRMTRPACPPTGAPTSRW
jgi:predicted enzyme related to lactoylglutathione lyase